MNNNVPVLQWTMVTCIFGWALLGPGNLPGYAQTLTATPVVDGLQFPVYATAAPGDVDRLLVTERLTARILVVDLPTQSILPTPFLDLPDIVNDRQNGLQGIAFHPDYAANGRFYVNYSDGSHVRIEEYTVSSDPLVADIATVRPILSYPHTNNHNGGWLDFSPVDGLLYINTGDNGTVELPLSERGIASQDLSSLKGKILRIDVDGDSFPSDPDSNYAIPPTNPFVGSSAREEIWAYGLRHPYRGSFDPNTGDLYVGDVGSIHWEEINFQSAASGGGENYGWRPKEGSLDNPSFSEPIPADAVDPLYEFPHGENSAVIGGYVYRGETIPSLAGDYFFANFSTSQIFSFNVDDGQPLNVVDRTAELFSSGSAAIQGIGGWGRDGRGDVYLIDTIAGDLYKFMATSQATTHPATNVWVGLSDGTWSTDANWQAGVAPVAGGGNDRVLEFNYSDAAPAPTFTNDLAGDYVLNGLVLNSPGTEGFTLDGNKLAFVSDGSVLPFITAVGVRPVSVAADIDVSDVVTLAGAGSELTLAGVVSGTGGLVFDRPASQSILSGDSTYVGDTVVRRGTLGLSGSIVDSASVAVEQGGLLEMTYATSANKLGDAAAVTLEFAELHAQNLDAADIQEDFGPLTLRADSINTIHLAGDSAAMILHAELLDREPGAVALVRGDDFGQAATNQLQFTTMPALVGGDGAADATTRGILPMVIGDQRASGGGVGLVTYNPLSGVALLDPDTEYATAIVSGTVSDDNVRVASALDPIVDPTTVNSLLLESGGSVVGGSTLTIESGNILAAGADALVGVASLQMNASEAMIWTVEDLTILAELGATADLTKAGDANLTLSGATTVAGRFVVLGGSVAVSSATFDAGALIVRGPDAEFSVGDGTVALDDATIGWGGKLDLLSDQSMTVAGATTVDVDGSLQINGGTLTTHSLANNGGKVFFVAGEIDVTGSAFSIDASGPLGADVVLDAPKTLSVAGTTTVSDGSTLRLQGGVFATTQLVLDGPDANFTVASGAYDVDELLATSGARISIEEGQSLDINQRVTIDAGSHLDLLGGTLSVGEVINNGGSIDFSTGTLQLTAADFAVAGSGLLGEVVALVDGQTLDVSGTTTLDASSSLTLAGGALVTSQIVNNGGTLDFHAGSLHLTDSDLEIDADGLLGADLSLTPGKSLTVDGPVTIRPNGSLTMSAGELIAGALILEGPAASFILNGPSPKVTNFSLVHGARQELSIGHRLTVDAATHIAAGSRLQLSGGVFSTGSLSVDGGFVFDSGSLELTNQDLIITAGELFGSVLALQDNQHIAVAQTVDIREDGIIRLESGSSVTAMHLLNDGVLELDDTTATLAADTLSNNGAIRGTGRIQADLSNNALGEIRIQHSEQLSIQGAAHSNAGSIDVLQGDVAFQGPLVNETGSGQINAREAVLRFADGLTNHGAVQITFGATDLFGNIVNDTDGSVIVSGSSQATFYDDLDNQGELRTSSGSTSVFFGAVSGAGTFTGLGTTEFEGPVLPGNSPGKMDVAGDVQFGPAAQLQIEIGGLVPGIEYDVLAVAGSVVADGSLLVELIAPGGVPHEVQPGDVYEVLTAEQGLTGQFTAQLPELASGLQWQLDYMPNLLALRVNYLLTADFDDSGVVNKEDLSIWQTNYGVASGATRLEGDAELDGDVDGRDFLFWQREHGALVVSTAQIPEPTGIMQLLSLMAFAGSRRLGAYLRRR